MANWAEPSRPNSLMRLSDFILGDKIYVPISTLHRLNIEPDSISYIERSETSNQPRWAPLRPQSVAAGQVGNDPGDIFRCDASRPDMSGTLSWWTRSVHSLWWDCPSIKNKLMSERSQWRLDLCAVLAVCTTQSQNVCVPPHVLMESEDIWTSVGHLVYVTAGVQTCCHVQRRVCVHILK